MNRGYIHFNSLMHCLSLDSFYHIPTEDAPKLKKINKRIGATGHVCHNFDYFLSVLFKGDSTSSCTKPFFLNIKTMKLNMLTD